MFRYRPVFILFLLLPAYLLPENEGFAQRRLGDRIDPIEELDREKGEAFLAEFRRLGLRGDYSFEFELRTMPYRGEERFLEGRMWGGRNERGPVTLFEIRESEAPENRIRLLVQSGERPAVWRAEPTGSGGYETRRLGIEDWFSPIMDTDYTPFDLQMPFVFWREFEYEGVFRVRGRPCHIFNMEAPAAFAERASGLSSVRMYLDAEFQALFRAESVAGTGEVERVFSVIDFKKVQDEWIVKTIDLRDETSRDKTRFRVNRAALNAALPDSAFEPENLGGELPEVANDRFSRVN